MQVVEKPSKPSSKVAKLLIKTRSLLHHQTFHTRRKLRQYDVTHTSLNPNVIYSRALIHMNERKL